MLGAHRVSVLMVGPVHYEVYIRKTAPAPWSLHMATEDRAVALRTAEVMLAGNGAVAVRVTKETLDPDTMLFKSMTVLTRGAPEVRRKRRVTAQAAGPRCSAPQDFYAPQARETIGRPGPRTPRHRRASQPVPEP